MLFKYKYVFLDSTSRYISTVHPTGRLASRGDIIRG